MSIDKRNDAPYDIVLPGLPRVDRNPDCVRRQLVAGLHFFTPEDVAPDLGSQEF